MRGEIYRVIKQRAPGSALGRNRSSAQSWYAGPASSRGINSGVIESGFQQAYRTGEILQQFNVDIEVDNKSQILLAQYLAEKVAAHLLFHIEHPSLAAAGVD